MARKLYIEELESESGRLLIEGFIAYKSPIPVVGDLLSEDLIALSHLQQLGVGIAPIAPITIPQGTDYRWTSYDGRYGVNPTAYVQYRFTEASIGIDGWQTVSQADIMDDGSIIARGDFNDPTQSYRLVVKP